MCAAQAENRRAASQTSHCRFRLRLLAAHRVTGALPDPSRGWLPSLHREAWSEEDAAAPAKRLCPQLITQKTSRKDLNPKACWKRRILLASRRAAARCAEWLSMGPTPSSASWSLSGNTPSRAVSRLMNHFSFLGYRTGDPIATVCQPHSSAVPKRANRGSLTTEPYVDRMLGLLLTVSFFDASWFKWQTLHEQSFPNFDKNAS